MVRTSLALPTLYLLGLSDRLTGVGLAGSADRLVKVSHRAPWEDEGGDDGGG